MSRVHEEAYCDKREVIGRISSPYSSWAKEVGLVSWKKDAPPSLDIREWNSAGVIYSQGIMLSDLEAERLTQGYLDWRKQHNIEETRDKRALCSHRRIIHKHICKLGAENSGAKWQKELNVVSRDSTDIKYHLRSWLQDYSKYHKGLSLTESEMDAVASLLLWYTVRDKTPELVKYQKNAGENQDICIMNMGNHMIECSLPSGDTDDCSKRRILALDGEKNLTPFVNGSLANKAFDAAKRFAEKKDESDAKSPAAPSARPKKAPSRAAGKETKPMKSSNGFGERLCALREAKGYTRADVAEKIDINPETIRCYEKNGRLPKSHSTYKRLAELFQVFPEWLETGKGPMDKKDAEKKRRESIKRKHAAEKEKIEKAKATGEIKKIIPVPVPAPAPAPEAVKPVASPPVPVAAAPAAHADSLSEEMLECLNRSIAHLKSAVSDLTDRMMLHDKLTDFRNALEVKVLFGTDPDKPADGEWTDKDAENLEAINLMIKYLGDMDISDKDKDSLYFFLHDMRFDLEVRSLHRAA